MEIRGEELPKRGGGLAELRSLVARYRALNSLQKALLIELNKPFLERRNNEKTVRELKARINQYREYGGEL